jgi:hypothetical protein
VRSVLKQYRAARSSRPTDIFAARRDVTAKLKKIRGVTIDDY